MKTYYLETSFNIVNSFQSENDQEALAKAKELAGSQLKMVYYDSLEGFHWIYENFESDTMVST